MTKIKVSIEIPKGSRVKYERNKETNEIEVDRILNFELPYNYGFVPDTLWEDGDPLDAIVLGHFSLHPGVVANVVPVALVHMYDQGESDAKLVCAMEPLDFEKYSEVVLGFLRMYKDGVKITGYTTIAADIEAAIQRASGAHEDEMVRQVKEELGI